MSFDMASLDEIEAVRQEGGVAWKPVRAALGVSAFGINVWIAEQAGDEVIGPHLETDEQAGGHEEAYLVLSGRATFDIGGEAVDVPTGTVVAVHEPAVERSAVAAEPGTTVLAVGGRIGGPFEVAAWEFISRAGALARDGNVTGAAAELERGLRLHPQSSTLCYHLACYESLAGVHAEALTHLQRAIELRGELRALAAREPDFENLRSEPAFARLVGTSRSA